MKKLLVCLVFLVLINGCNNFVWDPTGTWTFTITYYGGTLTFLDTFTLTGTEASGTVTGLTVYGVLPPQTGTYTKTGDYSISLHFDFWDPFGYHLIFDFSGTSTEVDPNYMTGTATWYLDGPIFDTLNWTAAKITNLQ